MTAVKMPVIQRAACVAHYLFHVGQVHEVFLFGSTARGEEGKDIDLILTVPDFSFQQFAGILRDDVAYTLADDRFRVIRRVLEWGVLDVAILRSCSQQTPLDIFLFPRDWLDRQQEVQDSFRHEEPTFTRKIAADARLFNTRTGAFDAEPASSRLGAV